MRRLAGESGQGLVEYALIIAIVSLGAIASLTFLKGSITGLFNKAGNSINLVAVGADGSGGTPGGGTPGGGSPTPPANGTPVTPANTTSQSGVPGAGSGNDNPVYLSNLAGGPAGFTGPGVIYGDIEDTPPSTYMVTVTQLGVAKSVRGCQFATSNGFTFTGVWIREGSNTVAGDWDYNGETYDWACVSAPAFNPTGATTFTSNYAGPANGTDFTGLDTPASNADTSKWFNANTNTNSPAGTNPPGLYNSSNQGGTGPWYYYATSGQVWICSWQNSTSYNFSGASNQDNRCS